MKLLEELGYFEREQLVFNIGIYHLTIVHPENARFVFDNL